MWVRIGGPENPEQDRGTMYVVEVKCEHAHSRTVWGRRCPRGCHREGRGYRGCALDGDHPETRDRCYRVFPTDRLLIEAGVIAHAKYHQCGCDAKFWMQQGERHEIGSPDMLAIQVDETVPDSETLALLEGARRLELGFRGGTEC